MQDDHYVGAILEEVRDQYKVINERLGDLNSLPAKVDKIADDVEEIKTDIKAIKAVVKNHEGRVTTLESA